MNKTKLQTRLDDLVFAHDTLDVIIKKMYKDYADDLTVKKLKAKKLGLKDKINKLEQEINS